MVRSVDRVTVSVDMPMRPNALVFLSAALRPADGANWIFAR